MDTKPFIARRGLNILLFILTVLSTYAVGLTWSVSFFYAQNMALDSAPTDIRSLIDGSVLVLSAIYVVVLLGILVGHELGHYLACRRYGIDATWPYFIPAPTLVGTLGAFIKIRSPITRKRQLFDIGAAGPIIGFSLALPALFVGLALSKVVPALPREEAIVFGESLILKFVAGLVLGPIPPAHDVVLHPIGFAGWVGMLVTAFNLFPLGQLDGGHIAYAAFGKKSLQAARVFPAVLLVMGVFFWFGWFVWILVILMLGLKHPRILDEDIPLTPGRRLTAFLLILVFLLTFVPDPIKGFSGLSLLKQTGLF